MSKYNVLYLNKHFLKLSSGTYGTVRVGDDLIAAIKGHCENLYDIDYAGLYLERGKKGFEDYIADFVVEKKIDYVIFATLAHEVTLDPFFFERLHKLTTLVLCVVDTEYYFEKVHRYYAQACDLVMLIGNYYSKFAYELLGIKTVHLYDYFETSRYKVLEPCDEEIDVSFVGKVWSVDRGQTTRRQYIEYLDKNGMAPELFGHGTKNGILSFNKMIGIWKKSKINLHFSSLSVPDSSFIVAPPNINKRIKMYKGRLIEVPLSGGFLLTEWMPDLDHYLKIGEECAVFYSKEDLVEKIKYYLAHDEERERIAKNGHERAMRDYDVRGGVEKVFKALKDIRRSEPTVYLDDDFLGNYVNKRFYYMPYFIFKGEFEKFTQELKIVFSNFRHFNLWKAFPFICAGISENFCGDKFKNAVRKRKFLYKLIDKIPRY
jgi:hypothetical protein